jgi:hypothetical protein
MQQVEHYNSVEEFVDEHREMLERVLRHSNDSYARACAWALLDEGSEAPDLHQLQQELTALQDQRGVS